MAQILIVDDDPGISEIVDRSLRRDGHQVWQARNGREAIDILRSNLPDVLIVDIVMPEINGLQLCQYVRTNPNLAAIPILFLTKRERIEDKIEGFEAGGDDYLTKPFELIELSLRVKALLRHIRPVTVDGPLVVGKITADPDMGQARVHGEIIDLTPVEFELLYYLMSHVSEVMPTEYLLQEVWGYPPGTGNASLVRMHVLNLRRKIEADPSKPTYLRTIPRHGYTFSEPPAE